jgi:phospholipid/cholesterol/gamma-HCH transport system substrate-binding protein
MDERVMQFRVGVMFLATLIITGILLVMFGKLPTLMGRYYPIQIRFDSAAGVTKDTPVRKSGILIGRVKDVRLTDKDSKVLVTAEIQSDKTIYKNEDCCITGDFVGNTWLTFVADPNKSGAGVPILAGTILDGRTSSDPTGLKKALADPIDTVSNTGRALTSASEHLGKAAQRVEDVLNKETEKNVQDILRDAAKSISTLQGVLGDEENQKKLTQAMRRLPDALDNMSNTFKSTDEVLSKFTQRSSADGKTPIERMVGTIEMTERMLRKFSEPRREGELAPVDQMAKAMENIEEITTLMRSIMGRLDRGEGSLGALMCDRQLYERLNRAAKNIEDVSWRLKPIVEDARVFTDKVSRHPGLIIRDAVKPGAGIK